MKVRPAASSDCERLIRLFRQLGYVIDVGELRARLLAYDGSDSDLALVGEIGAEVVGTIVLHVVSPLHEIGKWGRISALVVDQSMRRRGIGAELLRAADDFFIGRGCTRVELTSSDLRTDAHRFYMANGYENRSKHFVKHYPNA
ncbi:MULTISPECIES: GNAT family N-acetyltransferase [Methylocaldum]|jgi:GNAT superfamily N-acetyltransferase|uniref:GNAT family N-acetyltransferase n=1 Tax=unclassified Methylocaldum TaxID=2622260 RepID=UPI000A324652|nr:GNAT family N-acetyltransferase [Methylocaldum sp. RMAD-M]MBP1150632.1 GNAT superfamily N-acetyltransferase [Methylocaldum sp. RMAD-M]MDV3241041.1 GNAT family N-acetyltransferase [Methylocaldum sp.]MVF22332.1 GNAT family N-acetyltransferase [Methylocaldum sp. BRCS4]